jgi:4-amino-4-deoxy-L-arabinose transferase-like glycosyltransferase
MMPPQPDPLPQSLLGCLPLLWQRVLFPGRPPHDRAGRTGPLLLVLILPAVLLYPCLAFPLFEPDEGRYAEVPREMLARGEWVVPYLQGEPYLDKPPLLYWLVMLSYRTFGIHIWAARLAPALAVHGCVLVTFLWGRRNLGQAAALWGALGLGLAPGFVTMGRLLLLDGLLTFWVALALFAAFEGQRGDRLRWGWWLLAALACGLGVLTKGPVALVLLVPPLWAHRRLTRAECPIGWGARAAFAAVILAVALPWYVAVCLRAPEFAGYFLWQHNVVRFLDPFDHLRPVWFYVPVVLAGLLPATVLLVPLLRYLLTADADAVRTRCAGLGFTLLAAGWCLAFFSASGSKLPTYVLPAFPPLALALGYVLANTRWRRSRWPAAGAALGFGTLLIANYVAVPWYAWYRAPMGQPDVVLPYLADRSLPVVCYPRNCDSAAFHVGRDDLRSIRSREIELLRQVVRQQPRTVILCTHRHSLAGLRQALPPEVRLTNETHLGLAPIPGLPDELSRKLVKLAGETRMGLCDIVVVERQP